MSNQGQYKAMMGEVHASADLIGKVKGIPMEKTKKRTTALKFSEDGDFDDTTYEIRDYTVEGAEDGSPNADEMVLESSDGRVILAPEGIEPIDLTDQLKANGAATGAYDKDGATYVYQMSGTSGNWHASVHLEGGDAEAAPAAAAEAR